LHDAIILFLRLQNLALATVVVQEVLYLAPPGGLFCIYQTADPLHSKTVAEGAGPAAPSMSDDASSVTHWNRFLRWAEMKIY
jgi:hypothetical protein